MGHRLALRLIVRAQAAGVKEELVGDLLEEISDGRSQIWLWRQVLGVYRLAALARVRQRARLTPAAITLALCVILIAAAAVGATGHVLVGWLVFYYVAGTASLFAHMASSTLNARGHVEFDKAD